jgi:hypothetical protein
VDHGVVAVQSPQVVHAALARRERRTQPPGILD